MKLHEHVIALGSNRTTHAGKPYATIQAAITTLSAKIGPVCAVSRLYQTPAFPAGSGDEFVNAVVTVQSDAPPEMILRGLHKIEAAFGRTRDVRWAARTLDLDLIASGDVVLPDRQTFERWRGLDLDAQMQDAPDQIILPHPRLQDRAFVLVPMADVVPGWRHPVLDLSVIEMLAALPQEMRDEVVALPDAPQSCG